MKFFKIYVFNEMIWVNFSVINLVNSKARTKYDML